MKGGKEGRLEEGREERNVRLNGWLVGRENGPTNEESGDARLRNG